MLRVKSPAKINLFLEIVARRPDNFHNLNSVFQTVPLYDELTLEPAEQLELEYLDQQTATLIPAADNLIIRAVSLLQKSYNITTGGRFTLRKNIPSCAGLGGGSSNAATALLMAARLWGLDLSREELATIGIRLGSDIPFFLYGDTCLCQGRGELITPLPTAAAIPVRIISPEWGIPTPKAFSLLKPEQFNQHAIEEFLQELKKKNPDLQKLHSLSFNHFEKAIFAYEPRQRELYEILTAQKLLPRMSGSGSAVFLFGQPETEQLKDILPAGCRVVL